MNIIDVDKIETLDEFVFMLGIFAVSLKSAHKMQDKALGCEFLESDEREQVKMIKYQLGRSIIAISDLLRLLDEKAVIDVEEVGKRVQAKCTEAKT